MRSCLRRLLPGAVLAFAAALAAGCSGPLSLDDTERAVELHLQGLDARFAGDLVPISDITFADGPMKVTPWLSQSAANIAFSARNPQPGCNAVQRDCRAACTTRAASR